MNINKKILFSYKNHNCEYRSINKTDITEKYLKGLRDENKYLENKPKEISKHAQSEYINSIEISENNAICGIFVDGLLIGTSGIQNINTNSAISFGIFIFETSFKGKGFGKILVWATTYLSYKCLGNLKFYAGMKKGNKPSLNSFKSCGYKVTLENTDNYIVEISVQDLICPVILKDIKIRNV